MGPAAGPWLGRIWVSRHVGQEQDAELESKCGEKQEDAERW